jgi:hypothetical protein
MSSSSFGAFGSSSSSGSTAEQAKKTLECLEKCEKPLEEFSNACEMNVRGNNFKAYGKISNHAGWLF